MGPTLGSQLVGPRVSNEMGGMVTGLGARLLCVSKGRRCF